MTTRHRAYYANEGRYVYWEAPHWDPNGVFWKGPPAFSDLSQIQIVPNRKFTEQVQAEQPGFQLTDGSNGPTSSPVGSGDSVGANIEGIQDVNLYWILSGASDPNIESQVVVWLYDGVEWTPYNPNEPETLSSPDNRAVMDAFSPDGGWENIYIQVVSPPSSGTLNVYVTPHNES